MNLATPSRPVALLTGFLGSGKTTLVRALLVRPGMADTLVVVNEFGAVGIDHELIAAVHDDVVLLRGGCLCCGVRQDLARTLRDLHLRTIRGQMPHFSRVVVEASGLADPGPIVATLATHPLVCDAYALRSITALVDAEHGPAQNAAHPIWGRQVAAADWVLVSKSDLVSASSVAALMRTLGTINPIASLGRSRFGDTHPAPLFAVSSRALRIPRLHADGARAHIGGIVSHVLTAQQPLVWSRTQRWLAHLLSESGERLLRLKGIFAIAGQDRPVVVQAVHHSFYPLETLEARPRDKTRSTLVLIVVGGLHDGLLDGFATCAAG